MVIGFPLRVTVGIIRIIAGIRGLLLLFQVRIGSSRTDFVLVFGFRVAVRYGLGYYGRLRDGLGLG